MSNKRVFVDLREKSTARNLDVLIGRTVGKLRAFSRVYIGHTSIELL